MEFLEFSYGSSRYRQMLDLRQEVLRQPLGLDLFASDLSAESGYRHFGLEADGRLLACLMVVPRSGDVVQFRQMAVRADWQGRGLGRRLMGDVEKALGREGTVKVVLNARLLAAAFYEKLGYEVAGDPFIELGIGHQRMEKIL